MADEWELRLTRVPEGTHRAKSRNTPGADRDLLYKDGTNDLLGPTESRPVDLEELVGTYGHDTCRYDSAPRADVRQQDFEETLARIVDIAEVAIPFYIEHVHPFVKQKVADVAEWRRTKTKKPSRREPNSKPAVPAVTAAPAPPSSEVDAAVSEPPIVLTGDQFRQQVFLTLEAERWVAQRKEALSRAVVVDDDDLTPELRSAINMVLEGRSYQLDDETVALLAAYFRETRFMDAEEQMVPRTEEPDTVLRLAGRQDADLAGPVTRTPLRAATGPRKFDQPRNVDVAP